MTTIDDAATEMEELFRDLALKERELMAQKYRLVATGECLMCGEEDLPEGSPFFCCPECTRDYERKLRSRKIAGYA